MIWCSFLSEILVYHCTTIVISTHYLDSNNILNEKKNDSEQIYPLEAFKCVLFLLLHNTPFFHLVLGAIVNQLNVSSSGLGYNYRQLYSIFFSVFIYTGTVPYSTIIYMVLFVCLQLRLT